MTIQKNLEKKINGDTRLTADEKTVLLAAVGFSDIHQPDDFVRGELDVINGKPYQRGRSRDYDRGYADRHKLENLLGG